MAHRRSEYTIGQMGKEDKGVQSLSLYCLIDCKEFCSGHTPELCACDQREVYMSGMSFRQSVKHGQITENFAVIEFGKIAVIFHGGGFVTPKTRRPKLPKMAETFVGISANLQKKPNLSNVPDLFMYTHYMYVYTQATGYFRLNGLV